ncbi:hypothetical protein ETAA8_13350 [Anatilimnocola aggregata]|uniref:Uncharacterized protein n=1 Tax=Anatilimnocola aggregata TaxID=2528021 RepID=A0A517Y7P1_9BACT|nr:hypothetical protein ETAA8_13350 [Anatilimnocola aggregata]
MIGAMHTARSWPNGSANFWRDGGYPILLKARKSYFARTV